MAVHAKKNKPADPPAADLVSLADAEKWTRCSHQTLYRLVSKGKLSLVKVRSVDSLGRSSRRPAFRKDELESLFVQRPAAGQPIVVAGRRFYLRDDAKTYSGYSDVVLVPHRKGERMAPPATRQVYVITKRARGRPKMLTAWDQQYLDRLDQGRLGTCPEKGKGSWARLQRTEARDRVKQFLMGLKPKLPIRASEGVKQALDARHSRFLIYDELRKDPGIETVPVRQGRRSVYWWVRPGQDPEQPIVQSGAARHAWYHLNAGQEAIVRAVRKRFARTHESLCAKEIAAEASYNNNSYFRTMLAELVKYEHIRKDLQGYRPA
jgi:hypothetical protein